MNALEITAGTAPFGRKDCSKLPWVDSTCVEKICRSPIKESRSDGG